MSANDRSRRAPFKAAISSGRKPTWHPAPEGRVNFRELDLARAHKPVRKHDHPGFAGFDPLVAILLYGRLKAVGRKRDVWDEVVMFERAIVAFAHTPAVQEKIGHPATMFDLAIL